MQANMATHLGMQFACIRDDFLKARMPVDEHTIQPYGYLHGGASCALTETVGSVASSLVIDTVKSIYMGMESNPKHLRSVRGASFMPVPGRFILRSVPMYGIFTLPMTGTGWFASAATP